MRRIAIANQKGGVGKTTTTVNLAAGLALAGRSVLILDLDPQSSATHWLAPRDSHAAAASRGKPKHAHHNSNNDANHQRHARSTVLGITQSAPSTPAPRDDIAAVLIDALPLSDAIRPTCVPRLHYVPGSTKLMEAVRLRSDARDALDPTVRSIPEVRDKLLASLEKLESHYDFVLFDCPPGDEPLTLLAMSCAREVITPVEPTPLALDGIAGMIRLGLRACREFDVDVRLSRIVFCRVRPQLRLTRLAIASVEARFPRIPSTTSVRDDVRLAEAPEARLPIQLYDPASHGAEDYEALARAVLRQHGREANVAKSRGTTNGSDRVDAHKIHGARGTISESEPLPLRRTKKATKAPAMDATEAIDARDRPATNSATPPSPEKPARVTKARRQTTVDGGSPTP